MKTNTKGFTLIELLAVIVILAIIALIASPIILGIIQNSQKSARARSVEAYASAIQTTVTSAMSDPDFVGGDVVISVKTSGTGADATKTTVACVGTNADGVGTCSNGAKEVEVTYTGSKVVCDTVKYNAGGKGYVELTGCHVGGSTAETYEYSNDPANANPGKATETKTSNSN